MTITDQPAGREQDDVAVVPEPKQSETMKLRGEAMAAKVKVLLHEANVRRIVVKNDEGHTVMEIPVTAGVIAAVAAPIVTAVGALAALATHWTIEVDRKPAQPATAPPTPA